jgi:two-component system chemotaxis sensor kinase CheA
MLNKQCSLEINGKDVEFDKTIIEAIGDPLTHLVRNSVDHGVELPEVREQQGKPACGTVHLRAYHQDGKVNIAISDDGGGIDADRLKIKAVEKGILTDDQAASMSDSEALRLIFAPGFSTVEQVSAVSGRGVEMDVVKTNFERLGGSVDTALGKGTTITVRLPLTLAIDPSLIVRANGQRFAVPQTNISEQVRIRTGDDTKRLERLRDAEVLRLRGSLLPLVRLSNVLGNSSDRPTD